MIDPFLLKCPTCNGTGKIAFPPCYPPRRTEYTYGECKACKGTGKIQGFNCANVTIEPGPAIVRTYRPCAHEFVALKCIKCGHDPLKGVR